MTPNGQRKYPGQTFFFKWRIDAVHQKQRYFGKKKSSFSWPFKLQTNYTDNSKLKSKLKL